MKSTITILSIFIFSIFISDFTYAGGRCSGGAGCTACSNCSSCKNCAEQGGSCSVCDGGDSYVAPTQEVSYTPVPVENSSSKSSDYSSARNNFYEGVSETKKETSYSWVWWVVGAVVFLGIIGSGKK